MITNTCTGASLDFGTIETTYIDIELKKIVKIVVLSNTTYLNRNLRAATRYVSCNINRYNCTSCKK
jgi:hypothetical protein